ncbi:helix-turn-helix transcriptional regulator [Paracidovorax valerianellae]|uniref:helix-turn-helix transcriptional regulator n=1 Tax=Paracidovorax valerianellae TaxID=187868 RepID=UPI000B8040E3|nr:helix-turn-helix domain-containing protein [Paracidovorax valerianellae]MDA8447170.1 helix-turn-helix domain-containing protein [Paracidovorax valerianellae]
MDTLTEPSHSVYRIARACQKLDVSRSTVYRLVKDKKLVLVKLGERASGITVTSMNRYIQQLEARSDG